MASIYEEIGGREAVGAAVEDFYRRVLADAALAPYFENKDMVRLKAQQSAFIAAAVGGPERYKGLNMEAAHDGLGITDEAFDKVVKHLASTLTDLGVAAPTVEAIGGKLLRLRTAIVTA